MLTDTELANTIATSRKNEPGPRKAQVIEDWALRGPDAPPTEADEKAAEALGTGQTEEEQEQ